MEDAIKNIDACTTRIEQILPTLATRADLAELRAATRTDLKEAVNDLKREFKGDIESVRSDIQEKWGQTRALFEELKQIIRTIDKG